MNEQPKLTPWFPKNVRPVRVGFYERDWDGNGNRWNLAPDYWDGTNWSGSKGGYPFISGGDQLPWRGLAANPAARALPPSRRELMFCTASQTIVARKPHNCTWCGQLIAKGETHLMWKSVDDSWMTNRMHPECHAACNEECSYYGEYEYIPYDNERPQVGEKQ